MSKPISRLLFLTHNIAYREPFGVNPKTKNLANYKNNFDSSVKLKNHPISKHFIFNENKPDEDFIKEIAYSLQNVLKKSKNSYVHGFLLYSYLASYLKYASIV